MRCAFFFIVLLGLAGCGSGRDGDVVPRSAGQAVITLSEAIPATADVDGDEVRCRTFDLRSMVGQRIATAERNAKALGCEIRESVIDGRPQALTQDLVLYRVDVEVQDGRVIRVGSLPRPSPNAPGPGPDSDGP